MFDRLRRLISRVVAWLTGREFIVLLAVLACVLGVWGFLEIADEVREGQTQRIDDAIVRAMRSPDDPADPIGPDWLEEMGRDLTALGGVAVMSLVTVTLAGFLLLRRQYHAMWLVLIATLGGLLLSAALKDHFDRPRPQIVPHLSHVGTSSFPSGHSIMSAVVYLTLGALLARVIEGLRLKLYVLSVALLATALVGVSRVFLGVHYPTDVLAGWAVGLTWAVLCWLVARYLQRRGAVESPADSA